MWRHGGLHSRVGRHVHRKRGGAVQADRKYRGAVQASREFCRGRRQWRYVAVWWLALLSNSWADTQNVLWGGVGRRKTESG
mgnify:CR=1 FL=1